MQTEDLARDQRRREAQAAAIELGVEVVEDAQAGCATVAAQQAVAARVAQAEAERELLAATARHCYFQRGELQLLLRRAEFCAGELTSTHPSVAMQNFFPGDREIRGILCGRTCVGHFTTSMATKSVNKERGDQI